MENNSILTIVVSLISLAILPLLSLRGGGWGCSIWLKTAVCSS